MSRPSDPRETRRRRRGGGFTLIEVMVAMLLLVLSGAGGLAMVMAQIRATAFAASAQVATRIGQQVLDQMQIEPFATLGVGNSACKASEPTIYPTGSGTYTGSPTQLTYSRSCTVTPLASGMKVVVVTVSWQEASGRTRNISIGSQRAP